MHWFLKPKQLFLNENIQWERRKKNPAEKEKNGEKRDMNGNDFMHLELPTAL